MRSPARCAAVCEAISALIDGEDAQITPAAVEAHLVRCVHCRAYEAGAEELVRRCRLRAVEPARDATDLVLRAISSSERRAGRLTQVLARRPRTRWGWAARWAAAVAPLGAAVPIFALGGIVHPGFHVVASHVPTPCTLLLDRLRRS